MTQAPDPQTGIDARVDRLIESARSLQTDGSGAFPRLEALLAAAAAPDSGPQPGEREVLDSYRDLLVGTPSLAARRRRRQVAVVAITSTVVALGGGVAAAATGSLPGAAQSTAQSMLGVLGVHVPGPNPHSGTHPDQRGKSGEDHGKPAATPSAHPTHPAHPVHPVHPTHPAHPTPAGNSGSSRHHGNPTPQATTHPTPHHGKPTAPPTTSHRNAPTVHPATPHVTHPIHPSITR